MDTREFAESVSVALEDDFRIDTSPKLRGNVASLEAEDDEGNLFLIRITQVNVTEEEEGWEA